MLRKKKMVIVSHCILNQNSVVYDLARAEGSFSDVLLPLLDAGYGIYQLPCPETQFAGLERAKKTYEGYNTDEFKELCEKLACEVLKEIEKYKKSGYEINICIGIAKSPTCAIDGRRGHFWEYFLPRLKELYPAIECIEVPSDYCDNNKQTFLQSIAKIL